MPTEHIIVAPEFQALLKRNKLDSFDGIMAVSGGETVRSFPGRNTIRLTLRREDGTNQVVYLKRYGRGYLSPWKRLARLIRWPGSDDEAMREWTAISELNEKGFATPVPIAVGQRCGFGIAVESFLMTAEIVGGLQADFYSRDLKPIERRALALEIADLSRRFHATGFVHKDFYLCHIFVAAKNGARELLLIDLQRLNRPRLFHRRWLVKDLGALAYSGFKFGASRKDLMSFYKRYRAVKKLQPEDKALAREILVRVKRMTRHSPKHDAGFEQLKGW